VLGVRLGLRALLGGGAAGLRRSLLLSVGLAIGLLAVLVALAVPHLAHARQQQADRRAPRPAARGQDGDFRFSVVEDSHNDHVWLRVLIADGPSVPLPPGVDRLPSLGRSVVSPALAANRSDLLVARRLGTVSGVIGGAGLVGPDDYYSYTTVAAADLPGGGVPGAGFGTGAAAGPPAVGSGTLGIELALLVGVPGALSLLTVSRLGSRTRERRLAALRLVGVGRTALLVMAATENLVPALAAAAAGVGAFTVFIHTAAGTSLLGTPYFLTQAMPSVVTMSVVVAGLLTAAGVLGTAGMRRSLRDAVAARRGSVGGPGTLLLLLPLPAGLGMLATFTFLSANGRHVKSSGLVVLSIALASAGAISVLRPLVSLLAGVLHRRSRSLSMRLACARLRLEPAGTLRVLAGLCALVLVAGFGQAVLFSIKAASGISRSALRVDVSGAGLQDPQQRTRVANLSGLVRLSMEHSRIAQTPTADPGSADYYAQTSGAYAVYASCREIRRAVDQALPTCQDGSTYRLLDADVYEARAPDLAARARLIFAAPGGLEQILQTPTATLPIRGLFANDLLPDESVLITDAAEPAHGWSQDSLFRFALPTSGSGLERFEAAVAAISPSAQVVVVNQDLSKLELYRIHRATVDLGLVLGLGLGLLAFIVASADSAREHRRITTLLTIIGTPGRTLRQARTRQVLLPLAIGLPLSAFVSVLASARYLDIGGDLHGLVYNGSVLWACSTAGLCLATGVLASAAGRRRTLTADDIRTE